MYPGFGQLVDVGCSVFVYRGRRIEYMASGGERAIVNTTFARALGILTCRYEILLWRRCRDQSASSIIPASSASRVHIDALNLSCTHWRMV